MRDVRRKQSCYTFNTSGIYPVNAPWQGPLIKRHLTTEMKDFCFVVSTRVYTIEVIQFSNHDPTINPIAEAACIRSHVYQEPYVSGAMCIRSHVYQEPCVSGAMCIGAMCIRSHVDTHAGSLMPLVD